MIVTDKLSTENFHAFIDEQLTDEQYVQVEAQLDDLPEKIEEIQQCHIVNERLREVFDPIVEEPLPDDLYELALHGLERQGPIDGYESLEDEPVSYLELEDDIAAIDSLDIFTEDTEGESLIDDTDVADLEVLAQTEHLSEFDIDELKTDPSNIIPDIFDSTDSAADEVVDELDAGAATDVSEQYDPTDDLLESIDELSEELEKAQQDKQPETDVIALPAEDEQTDQAESESEYVASELDNESLELAPLEDNETSNEIDIELAEDQQLELEDQEEEVSARDQVVETLTSEEELTLEPLEDEHDAAFIQHNETLDQYHVDSDVDTQNKTARPRNLRSDFNDVATDVAENVDDVIADQAMAQEQLFDSMQEDILQPQDTTASDLFAENNVADDYSSSQNFQFPDNDSKESVPDDLVAEFFDENKRADFEVNEVVKQFEEVSQNFDAAVEDDHLFDDSPFSEFKYKLQQIVGAAREKLDHLVNTFNQKKSQIMGRFGGGSHSMDFNKSPFEDSDFSQGSNYTPTDTLDLSAFDDFAKEPAGTSKQKTDNQPVDEKVKIESPVSLSESDMGPKTEDSGLFSSSDDRTTESGEPDLFSPVDKASVLQADIADTAPLAKKGSKSEAGSAAQNEFSQNIAASSSAEFDFNLDLDGDKADGSLVSKFGDTLKFYKNKIAEMRAGQPEAEYGEEISALDKYKSIVTGAVSSKNPLVLAGGALVIGLIVVSLVLSVSTGTRGSVSNEKIDKLAIDTHLLNSQFNAKIVADADSAIIEKLQWFSVRVGHPVRLADIAVEDFEFKKVTILPTTSTFAAANIFENKAGQRITLLAIPDESTNQAPLSCRIPADIDGLCVWIKDSVRYVAVANLSLSRVRTFSEQIVEKL